MAELIIKAHQNYFIPNKPVENTITLNKIKEAAARIASFIHRTPLLTSESLNTLSQADLFFKCENFQKAGAFKIRGAANAVLLMPEEEKRKGVCTHSSGNFAQALALAAKNAGIRAWIVMPRTAPAVKKKAVLGYGAEVILCEPTLEAREKKLAEVQKKYGAVFIHPYNDFNVIAGHGSIVSELINSIGNKSFDYIISPVGGGGLISGIAMAAHYLSPRTIVIGAEPAGAADAALSLKKGKIQPSHNPETIADGLRTSLGDKTFPIISRFVQEIITVKDEEIISAMQLIWERMKIIIEPSSAVTLAAVLKEKEKFRAKKNALVLSGGNVDLATLPFRKTS